MVELATDIKLADWPWVTAWTAKHFLLKDNPKIRHCRLRLLRVDDTGAPPRLVATPIKRIDKACQAIAVSGDAVFVAIGARDEGGETALHRFTLAADGAVQETVVGTIADDSLHGLSVGADGTAWAVADRLWRSTDGCRTWQVQPPRDLGLDVYTRFATTKFGLMLLAERPWVWKDGDWVAVDVGGCRLNSAHDKWVVGRCDERAVIGTFDGARVTWKNARLEGFDAWHVFAQHDAIRVLTSPTPTSPLAVTKGAHVYESVDGGETWVSSRWPAASNGSSDPTSDTGPDGMTLALNHYTKSGFLPALRQDQTK